MENLLFLNLQTTGLLPSTNVEDVNEDWPHIVQISWLVTNNQGQTLLSKSNLIQPTDWHIPPETIKIHHITEELAFTWGQKEIKSLQLLNQVLAKVQTVVYYNLEFDHNFLLMSFERYGLTMNKENVNFFDLLPHAREYLSQFDYNQRYRLKDIHQYFFSPDNNLYQHDGWSSLIMLKECFWHLYRELSSAK